MVVLLFVISPREKTRGGKARLLLGSWRFLWSAIELRHLLTGPDGL
jgi:hypothetical protein